MEIKEKYFLMQIICSIMIAAVVKRISRLRQFV